MKLHYNIVGKWIDMAAIVCCLSLLFATSFAQSGKKIAVRKDPFDEGVRVDSNWAEPGFFVPNIAPDKIGAIGMELNDPFNKDEALYKIFPGYHYPEYKGWAWAVWRSAKYPSRRVEDEGEYHVFPGKQKNLTYVNKAISYTDDSGRQNMVVTFGTNRLTTIEDLHYGMYYGADISVANFTKYNNKWVLGNFTMSLGCYGDRHYASDVDTVKLGSDNYGCVIKHETKPPGGPITADLHIFGLVDNQYKEVLMASYAMYHSGCGYEIWDSEIKRQNTGLRFDDLKLITTGRYDGKWRDTCCKLYDECDINLPNEVRGETATSDNFEFRITRTYHFQDGHYKMISNKRHIYNVVKKKKEKK